MDLSTIVYIAILIVAVGIFVSLLFNGIPVQIIVHRHVEEKEEGNND